MSVFSAIFVLGKIGTQSHSAKFLNWDDWGDHVNSVPDLAARPLGTCNIQPGVVGGGGGGVGRGSYSPYILLNEIQTMFSQLAKRSARVLPADLCTDHAHYVKTIDQSKAGLFFTIIFW